MTSNDSRAVPGRLVQLVPGAMLAVALAASAKLTVLAAATASGHPVPVSPVLCAVLLGLLWRNTAGLAGGCEAGLRWAMHGLLRTGIALVGLRLTLAGLTDVAASAAPIVIVCIAMALVAGAMIATALAVPQRLGRLLAVGTAVCGCTAVVALSPAIHARHHETAFAVTCVVLFGSLAMLVHPWIAHVFFAASPVHAGIFLGTAIHDTSQVVGAALIYSEQYASPDVLAAAGVTKLLRNLAIAVLIPAAAWITRREDGGDGARVSARTALPLFVVFFVLMIVLRTAGDGLIDPSSSIHRAWVDVLVLAQGVSELLLICGMAAVGLSVSLKDFMTVGWRPLAAGAVIAFAVTLVSLSMSLASLHWS